jgi:cyclophilin family peptidyl-prolyl cis-trans isomerase
MKKILIILFLFLSTLKGEAVENPKIILKTIHGDVKIELFKDVAPNHVNRILELSKNGKYDGVAFHRVIDGFMAQTGDVQHGNTKNNFNPATVGTGGSDLPDLKAEFNNIPHERGTLSMARSQNPDSANSQFFICFDKAPHLDRQYTAFGKVLEGMEFIDKIKRGAPGSGAVSNPDIIVSITVQ